MDTNKLNELKAGYEWRDGIITSPGKFEGESLATLYYYDLYLNGDGTVVEVSEEERKALGLSESDKWVYLAESNDGFISLEFYATEAEAENAEAEDSLDFDYEEDGEEEEQAEQDSNPVYCPICDSGDASYMGTLGNRLHFRCNNCGMDFSHLANS